MIIFSENPSWKLRVDIETDEIEMTNFGSSSGIHQNQHFHYDSISGPKGPTFVLAQKNGLFFF